MKTARSIFQCMFFTLCLLGVGLTTARAQMIEDGARFGLKLGINGTNLYDDAKAENRSGRIGINGGAFVKIPMGHSGFSLRPELMIATKGIKSYKFDTLSSSLKLAYIELPLSLEYNLSLVNLHAGLSASLLANSNGEFKDEQGNPVNFNKDGLQTLDFGWHVGAGLDLGNIGLHFRLSRGLKNVGNDQSLKDLVGSLKNAAWSLTLAYGF